MDGYREGLREAGLPFRKPILLFAEKPFWQNNRLVEKILRKKNRPDGFIASVEKLTTPVYLSSPRLGLQIPEDVKLLSFTNLLSAVLSPHSQLQPAFEMGLTAASLLKSG